MKKHKPTAFPYLQDEILGKNLERSEVNIRTAKELLAECQRAQEERKRLHARSEELKENSRKLRRSGQF